MESRLLSRCSCISVAGFVSGQVTPPRPHPANQRSSPVRMPRILRWTRFDP